MVEFSDLLFGDLNEFGEDFSKKTKVSDRLHHSPIPPTKGDESLRGDMSRKVFAKWKYA